MSVRKEVIDFAAMGPLPDSTIADEDDLYRRESALKAIVPPVNAEEAEILMSTFGPDECFGLAWTLLHLVETTPGGVPMGKESPPLNANEWVRELWSRRQRAIKP